MEDRAVPGHWEGDLIGGSKNSYIATLVERHSRFIMLAKVKNQDSESVVTALIKQSKKLPDELCKSLTRDEAKDWRITNASRWKRMWTFTCVIPEVHGNAAATKTPIDC